MPNTNPQAVRVTNEKIRPAADRFGQLYNYLKALQAEGIPCSGGYGYSLPQQPLFKNKAFGPYLSKSRAKLNFTNADVPNSDLLCREQCIWLEQNLFLGRASDIHDIVRAFEKIYANRAALTSSAIK